MRPRSRHPGPGAAHAGRPHWTVLTSLSRHARSNWWDLGMDLEEAGVALDGPSVGLDKKACTRQRFWYANTIFGIWGMGGLAIRWAPLLHPPLAEPHVCSALVWTLYSHKSPSRVGPRARDAAHTLNRRRCTSGVQTSTCQRKDVRNVSPWVSKLHRNRRVDVRQVCTWHMQWTGREEVGNGPGSIHPPLGWLDCAPCRAPALTAAGKFAYARSKIAGKWSDCGQETNAKAPLWA